MKRVLLAGVLVCAHAGAADEAPVDLGAVTVTATKTERRVFETPAAVSTVERDDIDAAAPYGYGDVFETVPGVAVQGGPRRIAEEPAIRGFQDEQVIIRIDGARQNFNAAHRGRFLLDPDLVERIEVLRGGHSAIYGSGALGGVISLETRDAGDFLGPADGLGARLKFGYRSNGGELAGYATVFGQGGAFDALGSVAYRDVRDNLEDGAGVELPATQDRLDSGLLKLGFEPSESQRLEFIAESYANSGVNPSNANDDATDDNIVDRETRRDGHRLRYQWHDLTAVLYRSETDVDERRFVDGRHDVTRALTEGFDVYHHSTLAGATLTYGVEGYGDEQSGLRDGVDRPEFPDANADYRAYYLQAEVPLTERLALLPGIRHDRFEYESAAFASRDESEISPRLSLGYRASDALYLWAGVSDSFRAPSLTELYADGIHFVAPIGPGQVVVNEFVSTPDLAPEFARSAELGVRYRWGAADSSQWALSANVWQSRVDGFVDQVVVFISGAPTFDPVSGNLIFPGTTTNVNADADLRGWEAELQREANGWYAKLGAAAVDGERRATGEGLASLQQDRAYVEGGVYAGAGLFGARLVAAAARDDVPDGSLTTPGYALVDLFARYEVHDFELRAGIDNLLDREYRMHPNGVNQAGRTLHVSIARTFGD